MTRSCGEPLDLSTSRSTESTLSADSLPSQATALPSPTVTDPDSKPSVAGHVAVPCRRSGRQRRRTAKAAGDDGYKSVMEDMITARRHRTSNGAGRPAYVCQLCDKQFTKHSSLVRHTYQHSGQSHCLTFLLTSSLLILAE